MTKESAAAGPAYKSVECRWVFYLRPRPMMENVKNMLEESRVAKEKYILSILPRWLMPLKKLRSAATRMLKPASPLYNTELKPNLNSKQKVSAFSTQLWKPAWTHRLAARGAVCCTCRAKVLEGKVRMDANFALTEAEVAEGFVLTCRAHPLTEKVVVDYDAWFFLIQFLNRSACAYNSVRTIFAGFLILGLNKFFSGKMLPINSTRADSKSFIKKLLKRKGFYRSQNIPGPLNTLNGTMHGAMISGGQ